MRIMSFLQYEIPKVTFFLSKLKENRTRNVTLQIIFETNVKRIRISS